MAALRYSPEGGLRGDVDYRSVTTLCHTLRDDLLVTGRAEQVQAQAQVI